MTAKTDNEISTRSPGGNWRYVMKKLGDIMKELGFNPESSVGAQEAFVKNLIKDAYGVDVQTPTEKRMKEMRDQALGRELRRSSSSDSRTNDHTRSGSTDGQKNGQMSFNLRDLVPADEVPVNKKKSVS